MIDINELRRKANSTDIVDHIDLHANIKPLLSEMIDRLEAAEKERDALRAELDALKSREGEVVYRWLALDYSGFCYGSNPPDNLPNRCNLKAFYAPAEVAP